MIHNAWFVLVQTLNVDGQSPQACGLIHLSIAKNLLDLFGATILLRLRFGLYAPSHYIVHSLASYINPRRH